MATAVNVLACQDQDIVPAKRAVQEREVLIGLQYPAVVRVAALVLTKLFNGGERYQAE
jgi:hypothetical protein